MEAKDLMNQRGGRLAPTAEQEEEFMLLMSLSLDNLADPTETAQFEYYLANFPPLAAQWQSWQRLHQQFVAVPHAKPPVDFVERFELRLVQQERRRRLWLGVAIGSVTLVLWVSVMVGLFSMGAYLFINQGVWLSDLIQNLTYAWVNLWQWLKTGGETFAIFAATPQAKAVGTGYLLMAGTLLVGWLTLLRRSVELQEMPSQASVS
jgi:anti-sigma factor RsiW